MAVVATVGTDEGVYFPYDFSLVDERIDVSAFPRGELLFSASMAIPAKITTNVSVGRLGLILPKNFVYQIAFVDLILQSTTGIVTGPGDLIDFQAVANFDLVAVQDGLAFQSGSFWSGNAIHGTSAVQSLVFNTTGSEFNLIYQPDNIYKGLIRPDESNNQSVVQAVVGDSTGDATGEVTMFLSAKIYRFDILQASNVFVNAPTQLVSQ